MPITEDIDIFIKRYKKEPEFECHVCYENVFKDKCVTCGNGHSCCQKHHLQRVRSIYQENNMAYGAGRDDDGAGQRCFICREYIIDESFSLNYFKNLQLIQAVEVPKMMMRLGHKLPRGKTTWTNQNAIVLMKKMDAEGDALDGRSRYC
jgi:hypothetical protein